jgi:hypothetical protein
MLAIVVILLLLQGCSSLIPNAAISTRTSTPTQLVCPTFVSGTPVAVSQGTGGSKLIVVLFENNSLYKPYLLQAFDNMNDALRGAVQPGDKVFMIDMNAQDFDSAIVVNANVEMVIAPLAPPKPTNYPTPTATLPPIFTPQARIAQIAATQSANATAISVNLTATSSAFLFNCSSQVWQEQYLAISKQWEKQKDEVVQSFTKVIVQQQSEIKLGVGAPNNQVWEGLSNASLIMKNECYKYDRCILIVFSDMKENRSVKPENLNVDLRNVEVFGVMLNCKLLYSPECGKWIETWKEYLFSNDISAKSVDFINAENLRGVLSAILR